ncbi:MAG: hypothetical protein V1833_00035 [Elusimicrobiota bacterium]
MLDQITKRKLDSARQILVGKVPGPKAQVEQIATLRGTVVDEARLTADMTAIGHGVIVHNFGNNCVIELI